MCLGNTTVGSNSLGLRWDPHICIVSKALQAILKRTRFTALLLHDLSAQTMHLDVPPDTNPGAQGT